MPPASAVLIAAVAAAAAAPACNGRIGDLPGSTCATISEQALRRLSSEQYHNVIRALFPGELGEALVSRSLFPETQYAGFVNDAAANTVSSNEAERIADNAEALAAYLLDNAATRLPEVMPCAPAGYDDGDVAGCIDGFIADFGLRVYRRPLTAAEATLARRVFDEIDAAQGAEAGWAATMQFFLQAPALLYRVEHGVGPVAGRPDVIELTSWEMASRLSFFFLNSMPDDELMRAAAAGELATAAQVEAQARRLVADPAVYGAIDVFHRDWLRTGDLADVARSDPSFEGARDRMIEETGQLVRWVLEESDGTFETLLTTRTIPVAPELRDIYGAPPGDTPWEPLELPERRGLLTLASVNAVRATVDRSHPIKRGVFMLKQVLCASVPAFPGNIDIVAPLESTADLPTARERLQPLIEREDCRSCHTIINPPGFGLENFDAVGRYRTEENGAPIDPSGELRLDGAMTSFAGPDELIEQIAVSEQARDCYATQLFRFAAGEVETSDDQCSLDVIKEAFAGSGGDLREALVAVTITDAFRYRSRGEP